MYLWYICDIHHKICANILCLSFVLIFIFVIVVPLTVVNLYFNVLMIFWNKKILIIIKKKCKNRQAFVIVELVINVINVKYSADQV